MNAPLFCDEFELTLDEKNTLLIPKDVRRCIEPEHGSALFVIVGTENRVPSIYPDKYYRFLATQGPKSLLVNQETMDYLRLTFSMASRVEWDSQGRVLIPARVLERTDIKSERELTLAGVGDHLELWPRSLWNGQREKMLGDAPTIRAKVQGKVFT